MFAEVDKKSKSLIRLRKLSIKAKLNLNILLHIQLLLNHIVCLHLTVTDATFSDLNFNGFQQWYLLIIIFISLVSSYFLCFMLFLWLF